MVTHLLTLLQAVTSFDSLMFTLQENGWEFVIDGVSKKMYGTVTVFSGDNLASNAMGGFKEGGTAYRHCRQCLGTLDETRTMVGFE